MRVIGKMYDVDIVPTRNRFRTERMRWYFLRNLSEKVGTRTVISNLKNRERLFQIAKFYKKNWMIRGLYVKKEAMNFRNFGMLLLIEKKKENIRMDLFLQYHSNFLLRFRWKSFEESTQFRGRPSQKIVGGRALVSGSGPI